MKMTERLTKEEFIEAALLGGPGLRAYVYNSAFYCEYCAHDIIHQIADHFATLSREEQESAFTDSEKIPVPMFFPESDTEETCAVCMEYLYGPRSDVLT